MDTPTATRSRIRHRWTGRFGLQRSSADRVLTGVAAGVAARLGVGAAYVRAAFFTLSLAGGVGVALYLVAVGLSLDRPPVDTAGRDGATTDRKVGLLLILVGTLVFLRTTGVWFGDQLVVPLGLVAFGFAVLWDRSARAGKTLWTARVLPGEVGPGLGRTLVGGVLLIGGIALLLSSVQALRNAGNVVLAALVTGAGLLVVFGPWIWKLAADLGAERSERIRADERAVVAAHLHDSVLQTLALIQRTDDPRAMITLARSQERELRDWLYGAAPTRGDVVSAAVRAAAVRVERDHRVPVEVVTVGDAPLDERTAALVQAAGEAMTNAARHSGADRVSVYVESTPTQVDVWVTDQGRGFNPDLVGTDRLGIRESIIGRMQRSGGTASITSDQEDGTEVHLHLPREER